MLYISLSKCREISKLFLRESSKDPGSEVSAFPPFMEQSYQLSTYSFLLGPKLFSEILTHEKMNGFNMNTA